LDIVAKAMAAVRGRALKVVLPEGEDERILRCAQRLREARLASPALLGPIAKIHALADGLGVRLDGCEVRDPQRDPSLAAYAANIASGRHKMTAGMAERMLRRPLYFAGAMVSAGDAAAMVAGVANPTRRVIEAGMMTIGLAPGISTPSSFFLMIVPASNSTSRTYIFADCALNADPTSAELADIALASADSARTLLDDEPRLDRFERNDRHALLGYASMAIRAACAITP